MPLRAHTPLLLLLIAGCTSANLESGASHATGAPGESADTAPQFRAAHGGFESARPLLGVRAAFGPQGAEIEADGAVVTLTFADWGRGDSWTDVGSVAPGVESVSGRLEYDRGDGVVEWWSSETGALQVGWDLTMAPAGEGPLELEMEVGGAEVVASVDGESLEFVAEGRTFTFGDLNAWDDTGRVLDAWMEPTAAGLRVSVDDTDAVWPIHIDPTVFAYAWRIQGTGTDYRLGRSFASGDFNNDGYSDVAVSEYANQRVYVYNGSSSGLSSTVSTTLTQSVSNFGRSIATGDVNEDGYDDLVAGMAGSGTGGFYVYRGSASGLSSTYNQHVSAAIDYLGQSIALADFNGDGNLDVLAASLASSPGSIYEFDGNGTTIATSASSSFTGQRGDYLRPGDFNGDGYADTAFVYSSFGGGWGAVYIHMGTSSGLSSTIATTIYGTSGYSGDGIAMDIGPTGDFNADGYDDLLIGDSGYNYGSGIISEYLGSSSGISSTPSDTFTNSSADYYGYTASYCGDINGDGYDDALMGSSISASRYGQVELHLGGSSGVSSTVTGTLTGTATYDYVGSVGGPAGDVNGDGADDMYVGAWQARVAYVSNAGGAYVVHGYLDADSDGYFSGTSSTEDCDDTDAAIHPGAAELTGDGVDQNCDDAETCYDDDDGDGYLDRTFDTRVSADSDCSDTYEGLSTTPVTDCNDALASAYPGAAEVVGDSVDQDCDGYDACYDDDDNDGYLDTTGDTRASSDTDCADAYEGTSTDLTTDCDDTNSAIKPGATELTGDAVDQNCDGAETCYDDDDNDGYLDSAGDTRASTDTDCADAYEGTSSDVTTDCDDTGSTKYPGATEVIGDGIDQSCDGTETCYDDDDNDGYLDTAADTRASTDTDCADTYEGTSTDLTTDCNDSSSAIKPGATEVTGDSVDQNCDSAETCYDDDDDDGFLDTSADTRASSDSDCADAYEGTTSDLTTDCDDTVATKYPGATEVVGDGVDQSCDGTETCYDDDDDDGYLDTTGDIRYSTDGDCSDTNEGLATDPTSDCDDSAASVNPGAAEGVGDELDSDCDGAELCYEDDDDDGALDTTRDTMVSADADCRDATEATSAAPTTDCDDADATKNPAATETVGDGIDWNCDGVETCYDDDDDDGALDAMDDTRASTDTDCADAFEGTSADTTTDCDDTDADVFLGATELTGNGIDEDCDGADDCYADLDGDGHGSTTGIVGAGLACDGVGESAIADDCDDGNAAAYPGADELPGSGTDEDCDALEACYVDGDGDGDGSMGLVGSANLTCTDAGLAATGTDCDDANAAAYPGAVETAADGIDEDCDGEESCYADTDADGFGDGATPVASAQLDCTAAGVSALPTDCNDADAAISPAATEGAADGVDQDCDGQELCYIDADSDTHGVETTTLSAALACDTGGTSAAMDDCDDTDPEAYPGAPETTADGIDQDCDGGDACFSDHDLDGFGGEGLVVSADLACTDAGEAAVGADCDDTTATTFPEAAETCNSVDDNCDGNVDEGLTDCDTTRDRTLCGCASGGGAAWSAPLLALAVLALRRRAKAATR